MKRIRAFIGLLSIHPTPDEIARALATDYLSEFGSYAVRIGRLNGDDSLTFIGEYGFDEYLVGMTYPGSVWREWHVKEISNSHVDAHQISSGLLGSTWSRTGDILVTPLRDRGSVHGFLMARFSQPIKEKAVVQEVLEDFSLPLSLYTSFQLALENHSNARTFQGGASRDDVTVEKLTPRQISILSGMVEGKTNHELASELGYSVSTIRHETMRIYTILSVSDRKEAAKKALTLSLI